MQPEPKAKAGLDKSAAHRMGRVPPIFGKAFDRQSPVSRHAPVKQAEIRFARGRREVDLTLRLHHPFATLLAGEPDNICLRAINGYRAIGGAVGPLAVTVEKNIPVGAGLGGGSSDAAAMLRYLDRQATHRIDPDALAALAADLAVAAFAQKLKLFAIAWVR